MSRTMTVAEAKKALATLPEKLSRRKKPLAITRDGERVMALMSWADYEALEKSLECVNLEFRKRLSPELRKLEGPYHGAKAAIAALKRKTKKR